MPNPLIKTYIYINIYKHIWIYQYQSQKYKHQQKCDFNALKVKNYKHYLYYIKNRFKICLHVFVIPAFFLISNTDMLFPMYFSIKNSSQHTQKYVVGSTASVRRNYKTICVFKY